MSFETILRQIIREEMPGLIRAELQNMRGIEQDAEYLRTAGVAAMTGLTEKWILEVTRRGELKTYSTGKKGKKLYRRADVVAWLESLGSRREAKPLPPAQSAAVAKATADEKPRKRRSKLMIRENYETANL